jgi:hypothetical protein
MRKDKDIVWVINYRNGRPWKAFSHCKITKNNGSQGYTFQGRIQWIVEKETRFFTPGQLERGSVGIKDEVIVCKTGDWEQFMGENIFLFL